MSRWFWSEPGRAGERIRLVCLPHAGAGAVSYQPWQHELPGIEVWAARLPGRETRLEDPAIVEIEAVVRSLADELLLSPRPASLALFGHSMGTLLAYELGHELAARGMTIDLLAVSGRAAPDQLRRRAERLHRLPDDRLLQRLGELYGGIPQVIIDEPELRAHYLQILRADLTLLDAYRFTERPVADWPIVAFGGEDDHSVTREELLGWRRHTTGPFGLEIHPGDHFYLHKERIAFLRGLSDELHRWCGLAA